MAPDDSFNGQPITFQGSAEEMYTTGNAYAKRHDYLTAAKYYDQAARQGNVKAQYALGY